MLHGLDLLEQIDEGILNYSDLVPSGNLAVDRWRATLNLAERQALEILQIKQVLVRHGVDQVAIDAILAAAQTSEDLLMALASSQRPSDQALRAASGILDEAATYLEEPEVWSIVQRFRALDGEVTLQFNDPSLEPLLDGFHGVESNGRWTGPKIISMIRLPLGPLLAAGARSVVIRTNPNPNYAINSSIRFYAGQALDPIEQAECIVKENFMALPIKTHADATMIVLKTDRVFQIGPDTRAMGIFIHSLTISTRAVEDWI